ncbi:MAG TPA: hypothetical protein VHS59_02670 [Bacillota bacterium]|nr:hypothetical protein [Bacillota bacterium]
MTWKCFRCEKENEPDLAKCECGTMQNACLNCKYLERLSENGGYCTGLFGGCRTMKINIGNNTCFRFATK